MRWIVAGIVALLAPAVAHAQQYRFPTTEAHWMHFYATAYKDHSGVDWGCGGIRYSNHRGSDFGGGGFAGMDEGRDIVAAADGMVITVNDGEYDRCITGDCAGGGGFGNYVRIEHADGKQTIYGHLKQWSVAVAAGDQVSCGQLLGQMGSSGYSTGPHITSRFARPTASRTILSGAIARLHPHTGSTRESTTRCPLPPASGNLWIRSEAMATSASPRSTLPSPQAVTTHSAAAAPAPAAARAGGWCC